MLSQINRLITRFDNLSLRERGLVLLVILGSIYLLWEFLLMRSLEEQRLHLSSLLQHKQNKLNTLTQTIQELTHPNHRESDTNNSILNNLHNQLIYQENNIKFLISTLISPQNMLKGLKSVLIPQTSLTLLKLETQISQPLSNLDPTVQLFKHSLRLEFSGNYMDVLAYVRFLEDLPWKFYWDELDITINHYPSTHITLTVYTFSQTAGWTDS